MKNLYMITVELDEDSIYFTEMTNAQSVRLAEELLGTGHHFTVELIKKSPGFHSFEDLVKEFRDWAS